MTLHTYTPQLMFLPIINIYNFMLHDVYYVEVEVTSSLFEGIVSQALINHCKCNKPKALSCETRENLKMIMIDIT